MDDMGYETAERTDKGGKKCPTKGKKDLSNGPCADAAVGRCREESSALDRKEDGNSENWSQGAGKSRPSQGSGDIDGAYYGRYGAAFTHARALELRRRMHVRTCACRHVARTWHVFGSLVRTFKFLLFCVTLM